MVNRGDLKASTIYDLCHMGGGMEVAIIYKHLYFQLCRDSRSAHQVVTNVGGIGAIRHPYSLFQLRVGARKCPHRSRSLKLKTHYVAKSFGSNCGVWAAARPTVGAQLVTAAIVVQRLIEFRNQQGACA